MKSATGLTGNATAWAMADGADVPGGQAGMARRLSGSPQWRHSAANAWFTRRTSCRAMPLSGGMLLPTGGTIA